MTVHSQGQINIVEALGEGLARIAHPSENEIVNLVKSLGLNGDKLKKFLVDPDKHPYGRKLLYQSNRYEVLLMNWRSFMACAPHDHGGSMGWVFVLEGSSENSSYIQSKTGDISEVSKSTVFQGEYFFAGKGAIHKMEAKSNRLLTLHIYTPPITGMKVYDLAKCIGCMVSDDCGAWWPDDQRQLLKTFKVGRTTR